MHILVVSQYFWPENFRINDLCESLVKRGHEITVLTGQPNYPSGIIFPSYKKNKSDYNFYHGCEIVRVAIIARGKNKSIKLILNYISYVISASIGMIKLRKKKFDIIFVYEPSPITVGIPAILIKKIKKIPIVFWVLDLWPETLEAVGVVKSKIILALIGKLVAYIYNRCDLVLGQSKYFLKNIEKYKKRKEAIKYFPNWAENIFSHTKVSKIKEITDYKDCFKIIFAGNIGTAQDFPATLKAIEILKQKKIKVKLFIVGEGRLLEWVKEKIKIMKLKDYVFLLGSFPLEKMPNFYQSADALLVTLKNTPVFNMTIPGKVQSYMMAKKPILAMMSGVGKTTIEEAHCGFVGPAGDYQKLADNIIDLSKLPLKDLKKFGENGKKYAEIEFNKNKLLNQLEDWFAEIRFETI